MDDPLQHNDVIHASAFIDLLSRLVRDAGYQVVLSTHDAGEADYIARKCQSAGVELRRCDLPTRTRQGIVGP
jgi:exonuclease SbcC